MALVDAYKANSLKGKFREGVSGDTISDDDEEV